MTSKIAAGSLIDALGLKGMASGNVRVYEKNALVIVNAGEATYAELMRFQDAIASRVEEASGIRLETEPIFID